MSLINIPFTFSVGQTIVASQHNSNFSTIFNDYNGNITDANISAGAGIEYTKLALNNTIKSTDILSTTVFNSANIPSIPIGTVFGTLVTGQNSAQIYQAATDGIVYSWASNSGGGSTIVAVSDTNSNPSTTVAGNLGIATGNIGSICFPVKKNYYYKVTITAATSSSINFMPVGT